MGRICEIVVIPEQYLHIQAGASTNYSLRTTQLNCRYEVRDGIQAPGGSRTPGLWSGVSVAKPRQAFKQSNRNNTQVKPYANRKKYDGLTWSRFSTLKPICFQAW